MEISVRDWMIIIGVLLIVAVLLDGYRRMRDPNRIRVSLTRVPEGEGPDDDISMMRELPNGGARVTNRTESDPAPVIEEPPAPDLESRAEVSPDAAAGEPPLLTEPVVPNARAAAPEPDPLFDEPDPLMDDYSPEEFSADDSTRPGETMDLLGGITADDEPAAAPEPPQAEEVLMLHVVARDEAGFQGEDILQVLLAYNLRFGEMNFFHRHEESAGRGSIQFSVANMLQPGVFDIDAMSGITTTGLIFFVSLPGPQDMMAAFELMLETAQGVAEHLGGDVLDESRSATTRQTLEHMRQRIRDLERRLLAQGRR